MHLYLLCIIGAVLVSGTSVEDDDANIEQEVTELVEMVPFERVMAIAMEYAISDPQVKSLIGYLSGPKFKNNMAALEKSAQFSQLADVAELYNIDAYSLANRINRALDMPPVENDVKIRAGRKRRSPGEGVAALIKEAVENVPLVEIKEAYKYKIDNNPQFKNLMDRLLSGEAKAYLEPIMESAPFLEIKDDLVKLGLPLKEIQEFLEQTTTEFFDIQSLTTPTITSDSV